MSTTITFTSDGIARARAGRAEGILNGCHECAPLQIEDAVAHAVLRAADVEAAPGEPSGKFAGRSKRGRPGKNSMNFLPLPNVISAGEHIGAPREEFLRDPRRDAETGGGVLAVDNAQVDSPLREDVREPVMNDLAAGRADDIADEKYPQFVETFLTRRRKTPRP